MSSKDVSYGRIRIVVALVLAGAACLYLTLSSCGTEIGTPPAGGGGGAGPAVDVLTHHNDVTRTGQNLNETVLTPANVNSTTFGRVAFLSTGGGGMIDAQPLIAANLNGRNVVFVATEDDLVFAFDADSFSQLWRTSLVGAGEAPSDDRGCQDVSPQIGVTSTPVIDRQQGIIFLIAMSRDGRGNYHHRLHALDLATGAERLGGPVEIQASFASNSGQIDFDPAQYKARNGLLLQNGVLYFGWGPHCDTDPYTSWFMSYNASNLRQVSVLNFTPNGGEGGIWMGGGGPAVDSSGFIYVLNGNGTFDTTLDGAGFPVSRDFGNTFLKLSSSGGHLQVVDYFTMHDTVDKSTADLDFGSGGPVILPDVKDAFGNTVHLALTGGKDGNLYVVNRDAMGKFNPNNDNALYQKLDSFGVAGNYGTPAYFNGTIYICAEFTPIQAFPITNARLAANPSSSSAVTFGFPGCVPSISANGASNAIVWAVERNGGGILHAFDANNLANELYNSDQAPGGRDQFTVHGFTTPTISGGRVYVGTQTGVAVFGLLQ